MQQTPLPKRAFYFLAMLVIPLQAPQDWHDLKFSRLPRNTVSFGERGLTISVKSSASPLFYALPKTEKIRAVHAEGSLSGFPSVPPDKEEGADGYDDYALRIGLVVEGQRGLAFFERLLAPEWIKQLADLAPGRHLEKVLFLNIAQHQKTGTRRTHPRSKYIEEEVALSLPAPGKFTLDYRFTTEAPPVFALWLQSDGDDTKSSFEVQLKTLRLETE